MALNLIMNDAREELKPRITVFGVGGAGGHGVEAQRFLPPALFDGVAQPGLGPAHPSRPADHRERAGRGGGADVALAARPAVAATAPASAASAPRLVAASAPVETTRPSDKATTDVRTRMWISL